MSILGKWFRQTKEPKFNHLPLFSAGGLVPPDRDTDGFLRAYSQIGWLYAVVFRIALGCGEVKWRLYNGSERSQRTQVAKHPILSLLDTINPFQTGSEFIELHQIYMDLIGESFWVLNYNALGEPAEIWIPQPNKMSVVPDKNKYIKGYVYGSGQDAIPFDVNEVIHHKYPNPLNQYRGLGPAQAIAVDLDAEMYSGQWNRNFFFNSARPDGVIQFDYNLSDEQFGKLSKQWNEKYKGTSKAHQIALLEGGGKYIQIANSVKDMDFGALKRLTRDVILGVYGMPLPVMGITENVNKCLSDNHRVFTENGLRKISELTPEDSVLTFNPESKIAEFQKPINIYSYDYDDDLIIFDNTRLHAEVTPNHRLWIAGSNCKKEYGIGEWGFKQAKELEDTVVSHWLMSSGKAIGRDSPSVINIPKVEYVRTGNKGNEPSPEGYNVDAVTLASFCGLIGSEGWLTKGTGKGIGFGCSLGTKALNSFETLIKQLPFGEWGHYDRPNSSKNGMRIYQLANKSLWTWLLENTDTGAKNKHIPAFVLKGSSEIMQAFLDTYIEGDGHICNKNGTVLIRSHSPRMIDELLQLSVLLGYQTSISGETAVIISASGRSYFRNQRSIHREHYQGKVWCVEIPNGIFFTECNGKVHATGNSNAEAGDYTFARWIVKPRLNRIKNKLNEQLIPKFRRSDNLELDFDEVVPETIEQKMLLAESGLRASYLTRNEARQMRGMDTLPPEVGDVLLTPMNLIETPADGSPVRNPPTPAVTPAPTPAIAPEETEPEELPEETPAKGKSLTAEHKRAHWEAFANKTAQEELSFQRVFRDVFSEQKSKVVAAYERTGQFEPSILDSETAIEDTAKQFAPAIANVYHSGFVDAVHGKTIKQLDDVARDWILKRSLTLAKALNMTTIESIRSQLAAGFEAGESIQQLTKRIVGYFEDNAQYRAEMISRTEVIAASNRGAQDRYEKEDIPRKEWFAAPDARPSHIEANGQIVGIHDNFRVGDGEGPGPGQIGLPEEDINCRCTILPVLD